MHTTPHQTLISMNRPSGVVTGYRLMNKGSSPCNIQNNIKNLIKLKKL